MILKTFISILLLIFNLQIAAGQTVQSSQYKCYKDFEYTERTVFSKSEIAPRYKYGNIALLNFLTKNIDFTTLALDKTTKYFRDTVQISFIIPKDREMNNLTITKTKNEAFKTQLNHLFKESACDWMAGFIGGRNVISQVVLNIYYTIRRDQNDVSLQLACELVNKWNRK